MLTLAEKILFIIAVLVSLYFAYVTFGQMIKVVRRGQGQLRFDQIPERLRMGLAALVGQGRILRHRWVVSGFHYLVAWGFIYYVLVNTVDVLEGYISGFRFLNDTMLGGIYRLLADVLSVAILVGMMFFLVRRFVIKPPALSYRQNIKIYPKALTGIQTDSLIVVLFIVGHVGFRFLGTSFLVALEGGDAWQPFANWTANLWTALPDSTLVIGWHFCWWLALGLILAFLPYFPYSKHIHLFVGPFNFMTRPQRKTLGTLDIIDFEDESVEQFGVACLTDLDQTHIVDAFACIMCNRCQDVCPAYTTGKELSPSTLEINKRFYIKENMAQLANGQDSTPTMLDYAISHSAVWSCLSCGACIEVCPVGNEPMFDILSMRRNEVLMNGQFPPELRGAFTGIERNGNPWQVAEDRLGWTKSLGFAVPTVKENPTFEVLYWVGCAGAFDPDAQRTARAIATILHTAGINYAVLGNDETCTGDVARRAGNEYLFFEMAKMNINTLNAICVGKKKIVTGCPHCLHALGTEYAAFGGNYTVLHHTQLINELVGSGQLKLNDSQLTATFHDPCYLGRYNGEYQAPREVLVAAGISLYEMSRNKNDAFCCGGGGAHAWKEEESGQQAVNAVRYAEARDIGVDTLAVACPYCLRMLNDVNIDKQMRIKDVAEIMAETIG